jgi:hypothetical protein
LASVLQVLFQSGRLKISREIPEYQTLVEELLNFRVKITANAHDTYEAWREGQHDDLVLALAMACWYAERSTRQARVQLTAEGISGNSKNHTTQRI